MQPPALRKPSKDPYENAYLGAFLYALGYQAGRSGRDQTLHPNNHQQTPFDPCWADLSITDGDSGFLIEFKRDWANCHDPKEMKKADCIRAAGGEPPLADWAHQCHYLGYGGVKQRGSRLRPSDLSFGKYLEVVPLTAPARPFGPKWHATMQDFIQEILEKRCGLPMNDFLEYLRRLAERMAQAVTAQSADAESIDASGFAADAMQGAAVIRSRGRLYTLPFESLIDLRGMLGNLGIGEDPKGKPPNQGKQRVVTAAERQLERAMAKPQERMKEILTMSPRLHPTFPGQSRTIYPKPPEETLTPPNSPTLHME